MGGMTVLEYPLNTPPGFVKAIIPLATSARHSAWCISWGEAQRQSIYSDPEYKDGYYYETSPDTIDLTLQPSRGLAAARMAALLTYRSRDSFESRFGRRAGVGGKSKVPKGGVRIMGGAETTDPAEPSEADLAKSPRFKAWREHNDGHRSATLSRRGSDLSVKSEEGPNGVEKVLQGGGDGSGSGSSTAASDKPPKIFSAQSYLRYQGDKVGGDLTIRRICTSKLTCSSPAGSTPTATSTLPENSTRMTSPCLRSIKSTIPFPPPSQLLRTLTTTRPSPNLCPTRCPSSHQHSSSASNQTACSPPLSRKKSPPTCPTPSSS
jgi:homoserine O-acetyltransferase